MFSYVIVLLLYGIVLLTIVVVYVCRCPIICQYLFLLMILGSQAVPYVCIQSKLSTTDTLGPIKCVLIREVSSLPGANNTYLVKLASVLIREVYFNPLPTNDAPASWSLLKSIGIYMGHLILGAIL